MAGDWRPCEQCGGACIAVTTSCLAHAGTAERTNALKQFSDSGDLDIRGVTISDALLMEIFDAAPHNADGHQAFSTIQFGGAIFEGCANFDGAIFKGRADFKEASFESRASFDGVSFEGRASFEWATFKIDSEPEPSQKGYRYISHSETARTLFSGTTFKGHADFSGATFEDSTDFSGATFEGRAEFGAVTFGGGVTFAGTTFEDYAQFVHARFGPYIDFQDTKFKGGAKFEKAGFETDAYFYEAIFESQADFEDTIFEGSARFDRAKFRGVTTFARAMFKGNDVIGVPGTAYFTGASFKGVGRFTGAKFKGNAEFNETAFKDPAQFEKVSFEGWADFHEAIFEKQADFEEASFEGQASFKDATFRGYADFSEAVFKGNAEFTWARFRWTSIDEPGGDSSPRIASSIRIIEEMPEDVATFDGASFDGDATFDLASFGGGAKFARATVKGNMSMLGPVTVRGMLDLNKMQFASPVRIDADARAITCCRSRFPGGVRFDVRRAVVRLDDTDLSVPSLLTGPSASDPAAGATQPKLLSLQGANVAGLALSNVDLADCRFAGAHNLDKLRLEAHTVFGLSPAVAGWERRQVIAEESAWRAARPQPGRWTAPEWPDYPAFIDRPPMPSPGVVAGVYRALRKSREDTKDEPGAADFYYGEMEMRRNDRGTGANRWRGRASRIVLTTYWLVAGYGLRAWRSLVALAVVTALFAAAFHLIGFTQPPEPASYWTSLLYAFRSTVSLSDSQIILTAWGSLFQVLLRITGPVLLGLTLLALRSRVKR